MNRMTRIIYFLTLFLSHHHFVYAEEPSLSEIITNTGESTSVTMTGGATNDNGSSYQNTFTSLDEIDITATINIPVSEQGQLASLYIFIEVPGLAWFYRDTNGLFHLWDGDFDSLQVATVDVSLSVQQSITVIEDIVTENYGMDGLSYEIHVGYSLQSIPDVIIYNDSPIAVSVTQATEAESYFLENISPFVQSTCIVCHTSTGLAAVSALHFEFSSTVSSEAANYTTISNYIVTDDGDSTLLSKPRGVSHGGGVVLSSDSEDYSYLENFIALLTGNESDNNSEVGTDDFYNNVSFMSDQEVLRKAALILAGRLPSSDEMDLVDSSGEAGLREAVRDLMTGDGFEAFLIEGANNMLLTDKYLDMTIAQNVFALVDQYRYPHRMEAEADAQAISAAKGQLERDRQARAVAREPLQLIVHVVTNERPYSEILTADYIVVNPYSNRVYVGGVLFDDGEDPYDWQEGIMSGYYRHVTGETTFIDGRTTHFDLLETEIPHAGLLTSPVFLGRYPSTATNRNRARARWTYQFFLGVDIESLASRTTDAEALADTNNPTLNNPNCTVCHNVHDPVAGAFQNWGDLGYFRDQMGGEDSLPPSYKEESDPVLYTDGDTWYSDMLAPGFNGEDAADNDNSLQWLAQQIIADDRFASGTVKFWFQAVFGQRPLTAPEEESDADFATRLIAFEAQNSQITEWADTFRSGSDEYGSLNLKDLFVEMIVSSYFRANAVSGLSDEDSHEELGMNRLLTPEELNRKMEALTDYEWVWKQGMYEDTREKYLTHRYHLFYGGIDSYGITDRAEEMNALMSTVVNVMVNEVACPATVYDFSKSASARLLFPYVESTDTTENNETVIKQNIQYLHEYLLAEELDIDDQEISYTYQLFKESRDERINNNATISFANNEESCSINFMAAESGTVTTDPDQTLHAWMAVLAYLLSDFKFLHE